MNLLDQIRHACAQVAARAQHVQLHHEALVAYAQQLPLSALSAPHYDTVHHYQAEPAATATYILVLDAVNFGSGYFPQLQKRAGMSGYFTIASRLKDHFERHGPFSAEALRDLRVEQCAQLFARDEGDPARVELMRLFTQALRELGSFVLERHQGSFTALIDSADHSAERLAEIVSEMTYFQDVSDYHGLLVPLYKRAQITASDLSLAFAGQGYGHFEDLDKLTIFADNLVPHVLHVDGVIRYSEALAARIGRAELIPAGSPEEIEIRAVALHAVEQLVATLRTSGQRVSAQQLDVLLWNRGQAPRYKALPRHRTRTVFY